MAVIKVGCCVAYDWVLLKKSLPRVYAHADVICLAVDEGRKSWSGNQFDFDDSAFYAFVKELDVDKKVIIYEDCFSLPELNARQNCNRHRTLIAGKLEPGGWHIQIDSDEYFLDFGAFVKELKRINSHPTGKEKSINVCANWIPLIKKIDGGYLFVDFRDGIPECAPFATNRPNYVRARNNGHFNVLTRHFVLHETWARTEPDLQFKINNWGHASEELQEKRIRESYFKLWQALDSNNYQYIANFHPASRAVWPSLGYCRGDTIEAFLENFETPKFPMNAVQLALRNNRNVSRLKALIQKVIS